MATRTESGEMWLSSVRRARFSGEIWLRRTGQGTASVWPWRESDLAFDGLRCDSLGCVQDIQGQKIAFVRDARALLEDCAEADLVISLVPVKTFCTVPHTIIDRFNLWRNGAHAIWLGESGAHIRTVADMRGDRPWVVRRGN